jgi:pyrophosphatase PpaX
MGKTKAVLFDVDGTLLNTKEFVFQAFKHTIKFYYKRDITWEKDIVPLMGRRLEIMFQGLTGEQNVDLLVRTYRDFQNSNLHLSEPYLRTEETLRKLKQLGIKLAAVSSRSSENVGSTLELAKILNYFDAVITGDQVKNPKPHPEPIKKALKKLKVLPSEAFMVGDTDVDILAGKAAGTKTIGVTYGSHGEGIKDFDPDFVVNDISEILEIILSS